MGKYKVKAFGVTKDIVGGKETVIETEETSVAGLRRALEARYPRLLELRSLFIAVNNSYAADENIIAETDEIALIPPVSGG